MSADANIWISSGSIAVYSFPLDLVVAFLCLRGIFYYALDPAEDRLQRF